MNWFYRYRPENQRAVTNQLLKDEMQNRLYGVTPKEKEEKGNFVETFECLVCERIANNHQVKYI